METSGGALGLPSALNLTFAGCALRESLAELGPVDYFEGQ